MYWETGDAAKVAGLDAVDRRHQRQRQARRRLQRARQAGRSEQGHQASLSACTASPGSPLDGSIWGSNLAHPGYLIRAAIRAPIRPIPRWRRSIAIPLPGFGIRGLDIDRNGVVWIAARQRPHRQLRPAQVQGPAQWSGRRARRQMSGRLGLLSNSRPGLPGRLPAPPRIPYYLWVDQHDILGLGANTPIATGNQFGFARTPW